MKLDRRVVCALFAMSLLLVACVGCGGAAASEDATPRTSDVVQVVDVEGVPPAGDTTAFPEEPEPAAVPSFKVKSQVKAKTILPDVDAASAPIRVDANKIILQEVLAPKPPVSVKTEMAQYIATRIVRSQPIYDLTLFEENRDTMAATLEGQLSQAQLETLFQLYTTEPRALALQSKLRKPVQHASANDKQVVQASVTVKSAVKPPEPLGPNGKPML